MSLFFTFVLAMSWAQSQSFILNEGDLSPRCNMIICPPNATAICVKINYEGLNNVIRLTRCGLKRLLCHGVQASEVAMETCLDPANALDRRSAIESDKAGETKRKRREDSEARKKFGWAKWFKKWFTKPSPRPTKPSTRQTTKTKREKPSAEDPGEVESAESAAEEEDPSQLMLNDDNRLKKHKSTATKRKPGSNLYTLKGRGKGRGRTTRRRVPTRRAKKRPTTTRRTTIRPSTPTMRVPKPRVTKGKGITVDGSVKFEAEMKFPFDPSSPTESTDERLVESNPENDFSPEVSVDTEKKTFEADRVTLKGKRPKKNKHGKPKGTVDCLLAGR